MLSDGALDDSLFEEHYLCQVLAQIEIAVLSKQARATLLAPEFEVVGKGGLLVRIGSLWSEMGLLTSFARAGLLHDDLLTFSESLKTPIEMKFNPPEPEVLICDLRTRSRPAKLA